MLLFLPSDFLSSIVVQLLKGRVDVLLPVRRWKPRELSLESGSVLKLCTVKGGLVTAACKVGFLCYPAVWSMPVAKSCSCLRLQREALCKWNDYLSDVYALDGR